MLPDGTCSRGLILLGVAMTSVPKQDSARSWVVAFSCCWINFFSALMYKSSGVVYVGVLQTLNVSREEASWPLTLLAVFIFTTGRRPRVSSARIEPNGTRWRNFVVVVHSLAAARCRIVASITLTLLSLNILSLRADRTWLRRHWEREPECVWKKPRDVLFGNL